MSFQSDINSELGSAARIVGSPKAAELLKKGSDFLDKGSNPPSAPSPVANPIKPAPESAEAAQQPQENKQDEEVDAVSDYDFGDVDIPEADIKRIEALSQTEDEINNKRTTMKAFAPVKFVSEEDYIKTKNAELTKQVSELKTDLRNMRKLYVHSFKYRKRPETNKSNKEVNNVREKQK